MKKAVSLGIFFRKHKHDLQKRIKTIDVWLNNIMQDIYVQNHYLTSNGLVVLVIVVVVVVVVIIIIIIIIIIITHSIYYWSSYL